MKTADDVHARNLKDFLQLYNVLTEQCFMNCISNFNQRKISADEMRCINLCTDRYVSFNQRLMRVFMEQQTSRQEAMIKEAEKLAGQGKITQASPTAMTDSAEK
ncbi:mitochondrial import inner membrane translocase subunit Tim9-like [Liolophura sinensis]|uniref:mitochondrial import inner membrane translocase subunit Tim9-like n=1 Tax=Liolophura sinensis TaxID=3198878 RepID=UPI003158F8DE